MSAPIEDYAIIGDTSTVALVDRTASIDWWCAPRIDPAACFAALLGSPDHGRWRIHPQAAVTAAARRYLGDTLILETEFRTGDGTVAVIDFMSPTSAHPSIHRIVEGRAGTVAMDMELVARFDYGSIVPWAGSTGDGMTFVGGNDALYLRSSVPVAGHDLKTGGSFTVVAGESRTFSLIWHPSHDASPMPPDVGSMFHRTRSWWEDWSSRCTYAGGWREDVMRSLITLKALTAVRSAR